MQIFLSCKISFVCNDCKPHGHSFLAVARNIEYTHFCIHLGQHLLLSFLHLSLTTLNSGKKVNTFPSMSNENYTIYIGPLQSISPEREDAMRAFTAFKSGSHQNTRNHDMTDCFPSLFRRRQQLAALETTRLWRHAHFDRTIRGT